MLTVLQYLQKVFTEYLRFLSPTGGKKKTLVRIISTFGSKITARLSQNLPSFKL